MASVSERMSHERTRRDVIAGIATVGAVAVAGCSGDGSETAESTTTDDSEATTVADDTAEPTTERDATETGGETDAADAFEYTFAEDDAVAGGSLTGIRLDYPDGSGAVSDATVESATLAGTDVTDDLDATETSNDDTTLTLDFGGSYDVAAGATLTFEVAGVAVDSGSYTVEVTVNPQSGGTTFSRSF